MKYYNINTRFEFGKYKGKTVKEVLNINPCYLDWCVINISDFVISKKDLAEMEESSQYQILSSYAKRAVARKEEKHRQQITAESSSDQLNESERNNSSNQGFNTQDEAECSDSVTGDSFVENQEKINKAVKTHQAALSHFYALAIMDFETFDHFGLFPDFEDLPKETFIEMLGVAFEEINAITRKEEQNKQQVAEESGTHLVREGKDTDSNNQNFCDKIDTQCGDHPIGDACEGEIDPKLRTHEEAILHFFSKMDIEMLDTFLDMPNYQDLPKETFIKKLEIAFEKLRKSGDTHLERSPGSCKGGCGNKGACGWVFSGNYSERQMHIVTLVDNGKVTDLFDCFNFDSPKAKSGCRKVFIHDPFNP